MFNELETAPCCYAAMEVKRIMKYLISYFYANFKSLQMVRGKSVCVSPLLLGATAAPLLSVTVILRL